jgi:hypothetical protein
MMPVPQTLEIGGFRFQFDGCPPEGLVGPFSAFAGSAVEGRTRARRFAVEVGPVSLPQGELVADARIWRLYRSNAGLELSFFAPPDDPVPVLQAFLEPDASSGRIVIDGVRVPHHTLIAPAAGPLGELLLMRALSRGAGLYVHASAARWSDGVDVYLGASGAGKSTISAIAADHGAEVLSDDRTVLRLHQGRLWAYGTPFHGTGRQWSRGAGPVRGMLFLEKAPEARFTRLPPALACARLASVCFTHFWDKAVIEQTLRACEAAVGLVPAVALGFRPDASALRAAEQAGRSTES